MIDENIEISESESFKLVYLEELQKEKEMFRVKGEDYMNIYKLKAPLLK